MLETAKSEYIRLSNREIIFDSNLCDHDTSALQKDGQTDGQTICRGNMALCVASRNVQYCTRRVTASLSQAVVELRGVRGTWPL